MRRLNVEVTVDSTAPIDEVWRLLADVRTWPMWSSFDEATYAQTGDPAPHGVGAARAFRVGRFRSVDTVIEFAPPTKLAYDYRGPLPIKDYRADVELASNASGGTRITWRCEFVPNIPVTGRPMRAVLRKILSDLSHQLAHGAELPPASPHDSNVIEGTRSAHRTIDVRWWEPSRRAQRLTWTH